MIQALSFNYEQLIALPTEMTLMHGAFHGDAIKARIKENSIACTTIQERGLIF